MPELKIPNILRERFGGQVIQALCDFVIDAVSQASKLTERIGEIVNDKLKALPAPANPAISDEVKKEIAAMATVLVNESIGKDIAKIVRELLSDVPDDLVRRIAIAVKDENQKFIERVAEKKQPLIRQALPFAFQRLGWGEFSEAAFSESAVSSVFDDKVTKDCETVEEIVEQLVLWLPTQIEKITKTIVAALGFIKTPPTQTEAIQIVACRSFMIGLNVNDAIAEATARGELKRK